MKYHCIKQHDITDCGAACLATICRQNIYNLCCFRGKVTRQELQNIGLEMEKYIETCGGKKVGNPVSATFGIDGDLVDVELLIPIDKPIQSNGRYIYKEQLKLTNALMAGEELWADPQRSLVA